ncbi:uncharacterized protein LOC109950559 [Prunus persica]|uniref:uncharacterized protein LOC109950559 n=1 Tax=Prunus persica TaxID=3760 RepID=UPI0009AB56EB|nr:uncharacterized protein LOC109950559 [Prunus persica]
MFSDGGSSEITRTSSSIFSFNFPPNRSSKASEAKLNHKRDLQEVQLARTSSSRVCRNPPPGHLLAPTLQNFQGISDCWKSSRGGRGGRREKGAEQGEKANKKKTVKRSKKT